MLNGETYANEQALISAAQTNAKRNTEISQEFAREQMGFQTQSNAKAMKFSSEEAEKNRVWQERMSNTAHQREIEDLTKAGLNPVLSAMKGNGASTPGGASASGISSGGSKGDVDNASTGVFGQMLNAIIGQATALATTSMNNQTAIETTKMNNVISEIISKIGASAMLGTANINAISNQKMQDKQQTFEEYIKKTYPQTFTGGASALTSWINDIFKGESTNSKVNNKTPFLIKDLQDKWKQNEQGIKWFKENYK